MDYTGQIINNILIIKRDEENLKNCKGKSGVKPIYECQCTLCGRKFTQDIYSIRYRKNKNCGCDFKKFHLENQKFGTLLVKKSLKANNHGEMLWECLCDCGEKVIRRSYYLMHHKNPTCNKCYRINISNRQKINIYSQKLYNAYKNMRTRATNKKQDIYNRYINRNITICDEWKNSYKAFEKWALENGYKDGLTIDRIDNNGNYEPSNCRWVDQVVQANNRRTNVYLTYNGETKTMANWSRELNIKYDFIQRYRAKGLSLEEIIKKYDNNSSRH